MRDSTQPDDGHEAARPKRRRSRTGSLLIALVAALVLTLAVGFVRFAGEVSQPAGPARPEAADGIVVFTGGQDRINGAIELLEDGLARRLLISGVHPDTTSAALAQLSRGSSNLFACCIDLGRTALDTIGNADESAEWAREHGFGSLIVVTSSYHMPRSLCELARALPDVRLEGHAVPTPSLDLEHWWRKPEAASLLVSEYFKLLAAQFRLWLATGSPADGARSDGAQAEGAQ